MGNYGYPRKIFKRTKHPKDVKGFLKNIVKVFHLALHHSPQKIGSPSLHDFHHKAREGIRDYLRFLSKDNELYKPLEQFHDLIKLCYNSFARGDKTAANTYFYHMESILENLENGIYEPLKLPI
jgi:ribosomal protein S20